MLVTINVTIRSNVTIKIQKYNKITWDPRHVHY